MKTNLTVRAREAFAAYHDSLGRQIIDNLIAEVERLTDLSTEVHRYVVPIGSPDFTRDFTDAFKAKMYDGLRRTLYEPPQREVE